MTATPMREAWMLSATELVDAYRRLALSPVDALCSVLLRLEAVNPAINAVITHAGGEALECALQSARRWRDGRPLSALDGVPFTVKDNIPTAGLRSTSGSRLYATHVPEHDELPVARLRAAGAILVGKTNVPEFALHGYTGNAVFGITRNPWNTALTPGGSSGGAVAAVAAGIAPLAIATDGGGSIRRPCAHAGVAGLKPSTGRVPRANGFPAFLHDFEVIGPIARNVEDLVLAMEVMAGTDSTNSTGSTDSRSAPFAGHPFRMAAQGDRGRIQVLLAIGRAPVDGETRERVLAASRVFARMGHELILDRSPRLDDVVEAIEAVNAEAWPTISQAGLAWMMARCFPGREHELTPEAAALLAGGRALPAAAYQQALHLVRRLRDRLAALFGQVDYLLLPSAAALPWRAGDTHPTSIDGTEVGPRGHAIFTAFVNAAGLPSLALPAGMSASGMPIGLQLVGRHGADGDLCAIGRDYQRAAPWPMLFDGRSRALANPAPAQPDVFRVPPRAVDIRVLRAGTHPA